MCLEPLVQHLMEEDVAHHINRDDQRDIREVKQADIQDDETQGECQYCNECLMLVESCPQELVVNMVLVSTEDRLVVQRPHDNHYTSQTGRLA